MKFISRINKVFTPEFLDEMFDLYKQHKFYVKGKNGEDVLVHDVRHIKALKFREKLTQYFDNKKDVAFNFLGDGTNRMAFLVDGYVFKLALDDQGYIDNLTEFKMSREAQPYVTKTYETNGLFCVAEYVTLISYDEFVKQKMRILEILEILSSEYLLGDMGWTKKNYCNWGYRQNSKDLVILDYGHMMKIDQNKMICTECGSFLSYNSTYTEIECISCHKKMDFMSMKSKISKKEEMEMIDEYLNKSVKTTEETIEIDDSEFVVEENHQEIEVDEMISNQFESFKPTHNKKFTDLMDDEYDTYDDNEEELPDFSKLAKAMKQKTVVDKVDRPGVIDKIKDIQDPIMKQLLMLDDREEAEFTLSQYMIIDKIDSNQYNYYMSQLSRYYDGVIQEEAKEGLSTIGEIVQTKKSYEEEVQQPEEEDPYMAYYQGLLYTEEKKPYGKIVEEENSGEDTKLVSQMKKLLYMDDDPEDLFPEDFIEKNRETLGFDKEDSPEDEAKYDRVLENIKKVNNTDMDELEDMMEEEEEETDNIESYQEMVLQVIGPENESSSKQEEIEDEPENVINLSKQAQVDDSGLFKVHRDKNNDVKGTTNTIKVQRTQEEVVNSDGGTIKVQKLEETIISDDESEIKVEKTDNNMTMVVNEPKTGLSPMEKVFNQMKENEE